MGRGLNQLTPPLEYKMKHILITIVAVVLVGCFQFVTSDEVSLHRAAERGELELVKKLILSGVDKNVTTGRWRDTPLHRAAIYHHKEVVVFLINSEVDVNIMDAYGNTVLDDAIGWDDKVIIELLRSRGAKTSEELKAAGN